MHLIVVGISFRTADVDLREKLHFSTEKLPEALSMLNASSDINGSVILSTCNRVEVYASTNIVEKGFAAIALFLSSYHQVSMDNLGIVLYKKNCWAAVDHLFKVASSLDSMVIGEYQIQGQVRDAYYTAQACGSTDGILNKIFQTAIQVGKKIRSETNIGEGSVSIASLAVEMVKQVFPVSRSLSVMLLGSGKVSSITAHKFRNEFESCKLAVCNRSKESAYALASKIDAFTIDFNARYEALAAFDIVIASTSADAYIITAAEIAKASIPQGKTLVFIDLAIPRNIDPDIAKAENVHVFSIDEINRLINTNINKRESEIGKAVKIIDEISEDYFQWYSKQFIMPLMSQIKQNLDGIKDATLQSHQVFVNALEQEQQAELDHLLDAYSDKIIRIIMSNLKNIHSKEEIITLVQKLKDTFSTGMEVHDGK